jgi:hypothetical protein
MGRYKFLIKGEVTGQNKQRAENRLLDMIEDWEIDAKIEMLTS